MNRYDKIAGNMVADDKQLQEIAIDIEALRRKYPSTSEEALLISIFRDMAVHFRRGNTSRINALAAEIVGMIKERE